MMENGAVNTRLAFLLCGEGTAELLRWYEVWCSYERKLEIHVYHTSWSFMYSKYVSIQT